jgi:asparagine synthase (glutamine-hydrolysing)
MAEFGRVKTFSIGFEEQEFDELPFARMLAERYGTEHHEFVVRPRAVDVLPKLVEHYGEPFADSSAVPTYDLARLTAEHVTVALNGDGGDELFAGYDRYKLLPAFELLARLPAGAALAQTMAAGVGRSLPPRARRFLRAVARRPEEGYARTVSYFAPEEKQALYSGEMRGALDGLDSYDALYTVFSEADAPDLLGRTLYADTLTYLPGDLLVKVDIATMANSLEGRSPLLDHPLVEFAAGLPSRLKLRRGTGKHVLRRAVADLLPGPILRRRKKGFGVPVSAWFRGELKELLHDVVLSPVAAQRPFFRPGAVEELCAEHWQGREDRGPQLWALLMLELWCRSFLDRRPA